MHTYTKLYTLKLFICCFIIQNVYYLEVQVLGSRTLPSVYLYLRLQSLLLKVSQRFYFSSSSTKYFYKLLISSVYYIVKSPILNLFQNVNQINLYYNLPLFIYSFIKLIYKLEYIFYIKISTSNYNYIQEEFLNI